MDLQVARIRNGNLKSVKSLAKSRHFTEAAYESVFLRFEAKKVTNKVIVKPRRLVVTEDIDEEDIKHSLTNCNNTLKRGAYIQRQCY